MIENILQINSIFKPAWLMKNISKVMIGTISEEKMDWVSKGTLKE